MKPRAPLSELARTKEFTGTAQDEMRSNIDTSENEIGLRTIEREPGARGLLADEPSSPDEAHETWSW
jgi:hypothetical protein